MHTIAIQAGGLSSRMGRDKGLVLLEGIPLIEHVLNRVSPLGGEIILTTNAAAQYSYLGLPIFGDENPGAGALPGLVTALANASYPTVLVVACDMPFLNTALLKFLLESTDGADVVVPVVDGLYQPLHAVYRPARCLPAITTCLAAGKKRLISFFDQVMVRAVPETTWKKFDPQGITFFNVNTPTDLQQAGVILKGIS